ncbi:MAG: 5'-nucleotidase, lipoprotein e(P4) family [Candidatus Cloacimonetes bacterium]|nr:5'-nucleotidase, lipoprotein e(P4) family [Candidatus Cloacimonadota bacterium]
MKRILFFIILFTVVLLNSLRIKEERYLTSVLWQQTSAEYRALCYQAYNIAALRILEHKTNSNEKAIVVDIDETIIDNSPYRAERIKNDEFNESFWDWVKLENAEAVPGALDFLIKAHSLGFKIFYITNRDEKYKKYTENNLKKLGFPQVSKDHLFMRQNKISDKSARRNSISKKYEIILLIGDNLVDFSQVFYGDSIQDRKEITDKYKDDFGTKFIVIPNPNHGRWKKMFYHRNEKISDDEKRNRMIEKLKGIEE